MKKVLIAACATVFAACAAQASYLYWQVDDSEGTASGQAGSYEYNYARVAYDDGTTISYLGDAVSRASFSSGSSVSTSIDASVFSSGNYSFFVELVKYDASSKTAEALARSTPVSYKSLSSYVDTSLTPISTVSVWHNGSFSPTPEPTSALLLATGLAMLALRRRGV